MIIKKFTGKTEEDATATAQKELGGNIVIMNVRPLKRTGFLSFLKPKRTEVTVALEEEKEKAEAAICSFGKLAFFQSTRSYNASLMKRPTIRLFFFFQKHFYKKVYQTRC